MNELYRVDNLTGQVIFPPVKPDMHLYKTARKRSTGEIVALGGLIKFADGLPLSEPVFLVRDSIGRTEYAINELCSFVL